MSFRKSTRITFKSANADGSHSYVLDYDLPDGNHRSEIATVSKRALDESSTDCPVTELAEDVPVREILVKVLEDFDLAGQMLLRKNVAAEGAIESPEIVPPAMRPVHLQYMAKHSNGNHRYLLLATLADGKQKKYVFEVSEQAGNDVQYPDDFLADIGDRAGAAQPLLDAIRNLYVACTPAS